MSKVNEWQHLKIPYKEIEVATENFKTLIGRGGYGCVFKGKLLVSGKETVVAVKRLNEQFGQGLKEFLTEIQLLSGQRHPNLVTLLGYCDEGKEKTIVYEFAERGSLDQYIRRSGKSTSTTLTWLQRLKICADAARGLDHLHSHVGGHQMIIHRDIKSSNILIDENWVGIISDLGLSKLSVSGFGMSTIVSNGCGTQGYCEPEYYSTGIVTKKSDVFSFGVVLFEVLCGRLCLIDCDDGFSLSSISAKEYYENNSLDMIIDHILKEHIGSYSMTKFADIAYRCLHNDREQRPAMDVVAEELEEALRFLAASDAKYYGHVETYDILKARGAKVLKTRRTPMSVANPREVPGYELNPIELQIRKNDGISVGNYQTAKWNGTKVSVKILDLDSYSDPESINAFKHELALLENVRHPNVVQFIGAVTQNVPMMIVSESHPRGDLRSYLQKRGRLSPSEALRFALDIARGMNYLHEHNQDPIIHCDLRPKNILLDAGGLLKVACFATIRLSKISPNKARLARPATVDRENLYIAPEIYKDELFDGRVDVYSFGLILYEMMEGVQPFYPKPPDEAVKLMCVHVERPMFKKYHPPDVKDLIEECWYPDLSIRPKFSEIIIRLDKIIDWSSKQGWFTDTFKLSWN